MTLSLRKCHLFDQPPDLSSIFTSLGTRKQLRMNVLDYKTLIPAVSAMKFPALAVTFSNGESLTLPVTPNSNEVNTEDSAVPKVSLVCLSFRASSQEMISSWSKPFLESFGNREDLQLFERQAVYAFGDHYHFRKQIKVLNLLTGYIHLLDKSGRIRWQGFGTATPEEVSQLLSCTSLLLEDQ